MNNFPTQILDLNTGLFGLEYLLKIIEFPKNMPLVLTCLVRFLFACLMELLPGVAEYLVFHDHDYLGHCGQNSPTTISGQRVTKETDSAHTNSPITVLLRDQMYSTGKFLLLHAHQLKTTLTTS